MNATPVTPYTMTTRFAGVRIGEHFAHNGALYRKRSTTTAAVTWPAAPDSPVRFKRADVVHLHPDSCSLKAGA